MSEKYNDNFSGSRFFFSQERGAKRERVSHQRDAEKFSLKSFFKRSNCRRSENVLTDNKLNKMNASLCNLEFVTEFPAIPVAPNAEAPKQSSKWLTGGKAPCPASRNARASGCTAGCNSPGKNNVIGMKYEDRTLLVCGDLWTNYYFFASILYNTILK